MVTTPTRQAPLAPGATQAATARICEAHLDTALRDVLGAVAELARAAPAMEVCGAVLRRADHTLQVVTGTNRLQSAHRFELDPGVLFAAARDRACLVAFFHSHPGGAPLPSATDRAAAGGSAGAHWPGVEHWMAAPGSAGDQAWVVARFAWCAQAADLLPARGQAPLGLALGPEEGP